jgi:hypothetical protein
MAYASFLKNIREKRDCIKTLQEIIPPPTREAIPKPTGQPGLPQQGQVADAK